MTKAGFEREVLQVSQTYARATYRKHMGPYMIPHGCYHGTLLTSKSNQPKQKSSKANQHPAARRASSPASRMTGQKTARRSYGVVLKWPGL